jgi:hypothetical protein
MNRPADQWTWVQRRDRRYPWFSGGLRHGGSPLSTRQPSLDPCNQLRRFPLFYRLHVTADGTISNATAQPGTPSVDLPAGALSVDGIPLD